MRAYWRIERDSGMCARDRDPIAARSARSIHTPGSHEPKRDAGLGLEVLAERADEAPADPCTASQMRCSARPLLVADSGNRRVSVLERFTGRGSAAVRRARTAPPPAEFRASRRGRRPAQLSLDTANNRVLLYRELSESGTGEPSSTLGQVDFAAVGENGWNAVLPSALCWPYGLHLRRGRLAIADSGNNRVMLWSRDP
jgi:hypothetical protein